VPLFLSPGADLQNLMNEAAILAARRNLKVSGEAPGNHTRSCICSSSLGAVSANSLAYR
jgi:hypothetical protein